MCAEGVVTNGYTQVLSDRHIPKEHIIMNQDPHATLPAFIMLSPGDIAIRAYQLYLGRGRADGFASDDWLRAEQELRAWGEDVYRRRNS